MQHYIDENTKGLDVYLSLIYYLKPQLEMYFFMELYSTRIDWNH